jgi:hypothetical protein
MRVRRLSSPAVRLERARSVLRGGGRLQQHGQRQLPPRSRLCVVRAASALLHTTRDNTRSPRRRQQHNSDADNKPGRISHGGNVCHGTVLRLKNLPRPRAHRARRQQRRKGGRQTSANKVGRRQTPSSWFERVRSRDSMARADRLVDPAECHPTKQSSSFNDCAKSK